MAEPIRVPLDMPTTERSWPRAQSLVPSAALVVVFWWVATGLTIAMQHSEASRVLSLLITTVFAGFGAFLITGSRHERSPRSARAAFFGASLLWWWSATLFYGGWGVSAATVPAGPQGSLALALQAIEATLPIDLLTVATIAAVGFVVWRKPNRVAFWALLAFWGTLQTAKLNVFFGVRNPGVEFLPTALAGLRIFFGPAENSPLLVVTIVAISLLTAVLAARTRMASTPFVRHGSAMLAILMGLAVIEHVFLGVNATLPLWDMFLKARGQ